MAEVVVRVVSPASPSGAPERAYALHADEELPELMQRVTAEFCGQGLVLRAHGYAVEAANLATSPCCAIDSAGHAMVASSAPTRRVNDRAGSGELLAIAARQAHDAAIGLPVLPLTITVSDKPTSPDSCHPLGLLLTQPFGTAMRVFMDVCLTNSTVGDIRQYLADEHGIPHSQVRWISLQNKVRQRRSADSPVEYDINMHLLLDDTQPLRNFEFCGATTDVVVSTLPSVPAPPDEPRVMEPAPLLVMAPSGLTVTVQRLVGETHEAILHRAACLMYNGMGQSRPAKPLWTYDGAVPAAASAPACHAHA